MILRDALLWVALLCLWSGSPRALAGEWTVEPNLNIRETYTDNVNLAPKGDEEWDLITQVNPGLSVSGKGRRVTLDLNYRLQDLVYLQDSSRNNLFHQLSADSTAELIRDKFFFDANVNVSQQNVLNTGTVQRDNLSGGGDRANVVTYQLSPYWKEHLGSYADAELRYTQSGVAISSGQASDADRQEMEMNLTSGTASPLLSWSINHRTEKETRDGGDNFEQQESNAAARYRLTSELSLLLNGGYSASDFRTNRDTRDGGYWSVGAAWRPSRFFAIEAGGGYNDKFLTVDLDPSSRTSLSVSYRDRSVGSNPGNSWEGELEYRIRRVRVGGRYFEETTTTQQLLLEQQVFQLLDPFGDPITDPSGEPVLFAVDIPTLTDEVFVRERFELFGSIETGKRSDLDLRVFNEKRIFAQQGDNEDVSGWRANWNWRLRHHTTLTTLLEMTRTGARTSVAGGDSDEWQFSVDLKQSFGPDLDGTLRCSRRERDSSDSSGDFAENRVEAYLTFSF